jgi:hypothetical protein
MEKVQDEILDIEEVEENKEQELPEGITQAMVDKAILKHGRDKVRFLDILTEDGSETELTVLAVVPSRTVVGQFRRYSDTDPKKADEILVKASLLSHKEQVLADDALFNGAMLGIAELIPIRKAIVKNL